MIKLNNIEFHDSIDSISGQMEFIVLYDRIIHLVKFYNFSQSNYEKYIRDKKLELEDFKNRVKHPELRTIEDESFGVIEFTEEEMSMAFKEELYGIEWHFSEFQKMGLIILLYSEIEKFFDNIIDVTIGKNVNARNLKEKITKLNNYMKIDCTELLSEVDRLRRVRNNIVHKYDYWDSEILILEEESQKGIDMLKNLDDEFLSSSLNKIIETLIIFESRYIGEKISDIR